MARGDDALALRMLKKIAIVMPEEFLAARCKRD